MSDAYYIIYALAGITLLLNGCWFLSKKMAELTSCPENEGSLPKAAAFMDLYESVERLIQDEIFSAEISNFNVSGRTSLDHSPKRKLIAIQYSRLIGQG